MKPFLMVFIGLLVSPSKASTLTSIDVAAWGYQNFEHQKYLTDFCTGEFEPEVIETREIKSLASSRELSNTPYRFTLIWEQYGTASAAEARLAFINNNMHSGSKFAKQCAIWDGFRVEQHVYLVHTDVGIFTEELLEVMRKLRDQIKPKSPHN